jgi:ATPase subunit of ABC transporter with duplicated ATPase domains
MSLFNPAVWIGLLLSLAASFGFGYYKGGIDEYLKQQAEITRLNDEARQKEQALVTAVQTQATQLVKAEQNAKVLSQKRNTDIDSGALKLRIPVKTPICPIQTSTDAPIAPRDSVQANAELDRETAKTLIAITDDGDKAIRQLNSCIDAYNAVYQTLKGNP